MFDSFLKSTFCNSKLRCPLCRNTDAGGRKWRESMSNFFKFEIIDFDCPYGNAWGIIKNNSSSASIKIDNKDSKKDNQNSQSVQVVLPPKPPQQISSQKMKILTNNEWSDVVVKINTKGTLEDRALAQQIVEQSKSCGCKSRFAGMQYQLWEKYK